MTKEIIEKFLDKVGVTPGPWDVEEDDDRLSRPFFISYTPNKGAIQYVCELGDNCTDITGYTEYLNAHILTASREMLATLIDITYSQNMYYSHMFLESISNNFFKKEHANQIEVIESALPGYTWEGIKEELERIEDEE
jgi:hypothetical protein